MESVPAPTRLERAAVLLLVALALAARVPLAWQDLPYTEQVDEPITVSAALDAVRRGDPDPRTFVYGSLMVHVDEAVDVAVAGVRPLVDSRPLRWDTVDASDFSSWEYRLFLVANRLTVCAIGALAVAIAWWTGRTLAGPSAGLLGALFLAGTPWHAVHSALATNDAPVATLALGAAALAVTAVRRGEARLAVAALFVGGLASSCKYNALPAVAPGLLALAIVARTSVGRTSVGRKPLRWLALALVAPIAGFLAGTPYALVEPLALARDVGAETSHYLAGDGVPRGLPHLAIDLAEFVREAGVLVPALAAAGVALVAADRGRRRLLAVALAFPAVYAAEMSATVVDAHRNWVAVHAFVAMLAGVGVTEVARALARRNATASTAALVGGSVAGAIFVALGIASAARAGSHVETRTAAVDGAARLAKERGWRSIGVASELEIVPDDLARLPVAAEVLPIDVLRCRAYDAVLLPVGIRGRRGRGGPESPRAAWLASRLPDPVGAVLVVGDRPLPELGLVDNPGVQVVERRPAEDPCEPYSGPPAPPRHRSRPGF